MAVLELRSNLAVCSWIDLDDPIHSVSQLQPLNGAVLSAMQNDKYSQVDIILKIGKFFCRIVFHEHTETNKIILDLSRKRQQKSLRVYIPVMSHETKVKLKGERLLGFKDGGNSVFAAPTSPLTSSLNGQINGLCPFHHHDVPISHESKFYD
ncbi:hypothetical protein NC652_013255 [Populus alba x Populus x berolinensis]|nr:hypothetical protein NC652_013255 [Populus alba x Populus x berolinensis]